MAGLRGPVLSEPPPQGNGVTPVPGRREDGDVRAATEGSLVPPGVSGAAPPPKDCSKGFGSRLNDPPAPASDSAFSALVDVSTVGLVASDWSSDARGLLATVR